MLKDTLPTFKYHIRNPLNRVIRTVEIIELESDKADKRIKIFKDVHTTPSCTIDRISKKYYHIGAISTLQHRSLTTYAKMDI